MGEVDRSLGSLLNGAIQLFQETFKYKPGFAGYAPGRVNLIGEHTDYNDGFVLPIALSVATVVVGSPNRTNFCYIKTTKNVGESDFSQFSLPSTEKLLPGEPFWANYVKGVVAHFIGEVKGFDAVVSSTVPLGGGLSSSASLEVATYTFLEAMSSKTDSLVGKALACQKAEHNFANTPCGPMDQFVSVLAEKDNALLLDCLDLTYKLIPVNLADHTIVITNSNVKHNLNSGEYAVRRSQCEEAAKLLRVSSLRHASLEMLNASKSKLSDVLFRRARHVITEIQRTTEAASAMVSSDIARFGQLMNESHDSLRDDFEVSCSELDTLVSAARELSQVRGSRMTGAGFGGCTVTLVLKDAVDKLKDHLVAKYSGRLNFYFACPSRGAYHIDLTSDLHL